MDLYPAEQEQRSKQVRSHWWIFALALLRWYSIYMLQIEVLKYGAEARLV